MQASRRLQAPIASEAKLSSLSGKPGEKADREELTIVRSSLLERYVKVAGLAWQALQFGTLKRGLHSAEYGNERRLTR